MFIFLQNVEDWRRPGTVFRDLLSAWGSSGSLDKIRKGRAPYGIGIHGALQWNIDQSLRRLKTDYLDVVQLHSCSEDVLRSGEAVEVLVRARKAGKCRFIGYSGDDKSAITAIDTGHFDADPDVDQYRRSGRLRFGRGRGQTRSRRRSQTAHRQCAMDAQRAPKLA